MPAFIVSTCAGGRGCFLMRSPCGVFPAFHPLSCFALVALLANMALFRILRGFLARFPLFRVCLLGSRALRGLCGFCTREMFGG